VRAGLDPQRLFEILSTSGGRSHHFLKRFPNVLAGDFTPYFGIGLSRTDVALGLGLAAGFGLPRPVALAGRQAFPAAPARACARAVATARHLRAVTGAPLALEPLLRERSFGDLRGRPYAELNVDMFAPDYAPPNGETWEAFHARVDQAWARVQDLAAGIDGHLAVVTHGLVCRSLAAPHLALPHGEVVPLRCDH